MKKQLAILSVVSLFTIGGMQARVQRDADQDAKIGSQTGLNIVVVNTIDVMQQSAMGQKVVKDFEEERKKTTQKLEARQQMIMAQVKEFEDQKSTMTEAALRRRTGELEDEQAKFKRDVAEAEAGLREKMQERTEVVAQAVENSIRKVAIESNADIVLDEQTGRVVWARDDLKMTNLAIAAMDREDATAGTKKGLGETKVASTKDDTKIKKGQSA